jgi:hypothetical protein
MPLLYKELSFQIRGALYEVYNSVASVLSVPSVYKIRRDLKRYYV